MTQAPFLALEGLDGVGKSTQVPLLAEWLRKSGRHVTLCSDPGSTPIGVDIRQLLLDRQKQMGLLCEAFLFMASRAELVEQVIQPALQSNTIVVSDRFLLSNVVYQGHAGGLKPELLWEIGLIATRGMLPDLTIVLDMPSDQALRRRQNTADRMESRNLAYFEAVRQGFLVEARKRPERICVVDASPPIEAVQRRIRHEVSRVLGADSGA
jgi:dTMP kinase